VARIKSSVLVLEDERDWRKIHSDKLEEAGFKVISTCEYEKAINFVKSDKSSIVRAAVIDQLLYYFYDDRKEPQDKQGSSVLEYIEKNRPDIVRIMVSAANVKLAPGNSAKATEIWEELRRESHAEELFFKGLLEKNYQPLIDYLKKAIREKSKRRNVFKGDHYFIVAGNTAYYVPDYLNIKQKLVQKGTSTSRTKKIFNFFSNNYKKCKKTDFKPGQQSFRLLEAVAEKFLKGEALMFTREDLAQVFYKKKFDDLVKEEVVKIQPNLMANELMDSISIPEETPENVQFHTQERLTCRKLPHDLGKKVRNAVRSRIRGQRRKVNKLLCKAAGVPDGLFVGEGRNIDLWKANFFVFRVNK
jgi:CheY-like chemotaxis protein